MPETIDIHDILSKIKELDKEEQFTLLERLVGLLRKNDAPGIPLKLSQITGFGSKVWQGINIDDYIDQERQW